MTLENLREIIGKEVRKAIKEELRDLILEAVEIASRPDQKSFDRPAFQEKTQPPVSEKKAPATGNVLQDVLAETAAGMTSEDYVNIYGTSPKQSLAESYSTLGSVGDSLPEEADNSFEPVGVNLDGFPSFVKNAKAILDASYNKDKNRHAV